MHPLKAWLRARKTTAASLASDVGVRRETIQLIASGDSEPSLSVAVKLERVTGIPVADFVRRA